MMNATTDPWVITPREKFKYQEQFKTLQPQNGFVTGAQAKGFFLQSQLPPIVLGHIWALADTDSDGNMNINEFSIACKLINLKLRGMELPKVLPPSLLSTAMASGISVGVSPTPTLTPTAMSPLDPLKAASVPLAAAPVTTLPGIVPATLPGIMPQVVAGGVPLPGMVPNAMTGPSIPLAMATQAAMMPPPAMVNKLITSPPTVDKVMPVPAPPTPPQSQPPSRNMSISERAPSMESLSQGSVDWIIKAPAKRKYSQVFNATDRQRTGYLTGVQARGILMQSKLPQNVLAQIWTLSDLDSDGRLSCDEFILAMFLCDKAMNGEKIPTPLPVDWIPPSFRKNKSRQGSVSGVGNSRGGSVAGSRHASVSSQGALDADPAAGLPQTSFEDKRKENFDKGQAELDRRRKLLQDQQRKEKEERERKEREETEKRERARLEAERKQQEELERQLQKQRELEMEREEQRKRELEAKEAARKELEKQRQQEWEQARIAEMNTHKEREQERVLKQKAHNTQLHVELSTLNEKIKDLSQKICDTRAGVTNVKSVIDGMRTQRDTSMSEMAQLKARIKEQNTKLMQLTQERSKWDAKSKAAGGGVTNAGQAEALNAAFANKQLIIKQLKDKVENISKEIEAKKEDINSNDVQVAEVKGELSALIGKCEELYADYDKQRTQVLELKYNKKNEHVSSSSAAWDTGSSSAAWGAPAAATNSYEAPTTVEDTSGPAPEGFVKYRAVYEFSARNADEITFGLGDIILVPLEQNAEPGWLAGEINGHTGWFPETYVEKLDESATEQSSATTTTTAAFGATTTNSAAPTGLSDFTAQDIFNENTQIDSAAPVDAFNGDVEYYIAAYPYDSAEPGDLNFGAGEMVMVIKKEGDWWTGTIGNRTGMFPSNYVQKADVGQTTTATEVATAAETKEAPEVTTTTTNNFNTDNDDFSTLNDAAQLNAQTNDYISSIIAAVPAALDISASSATTATTTTSAYHMEFNSETTTTTTPFEQYAGNNIMTTTKDDVAAVSVAAAAAAAAYAEERRTNDDLDTEVSQINTQSNPLSQAAVAAAANNETSASESYSRPMSRTSSMTPGMRAKRSDIAQVIAPYEATSAEQLSLTRGQLIMIRKKTDSGWWEGELQAKGRRRQIGWFPATYVKVLQGGRNSGRNTPVSGSRIEMTETILDKVIALYPYKAQNDDELSFDKDDIISVLGRDEPEWWRGELNGLTGLFPSNYVGPFVTSGKQMRNGIKT